MIFFLLLSLLAVPALSALEQLRCYPGSNYTFNLLDGREANVYGAEVNVFFPREKVRVYTFPNTDTVNILVNGTIIIFKGKFSISNSGRPAQRIYHVVNIQAKGLGKLKKYYDKTNFTEWQIFIMRNEIQRLKIPREIEIELRKIADNCVGFQMCPKIGNIEPEDYANSTNPNDFVPISAYSKIQKTNSIIDETKKDAELQSLTNSVVDNTLVKLVSQLKEKQDDKIKIPDINKHFSLGSGFLQTSARFAATDGHFSDLTTLKRTNNSKLERQDSKFVASCDFGLSTAQIVYDNYKLIFGQMNACGKLTADIKEIAIDSKVSVDYNLHPCKVKFEYFNITDIGKVNIEATDLGPLSFLASSLVNFIRKKWQTNIAALLETQISSILNNEITHFNCEDYRP